MRQQLEDMNYRARTTSKIETLLEELYNMGYNTTDIWNETSVRPFGWSESVNDMAIIIGNKKIDNINDPYGYHTAGNFISVEDFEIYLEKYVKLVRD